jgi:hypothetical protein
MRTGAFGNVGYRRARQVSLGLAMVASAASLCGAAHAAETAAETAAATATDAEAAPTVSSVTVTGDSRPLDHATGLAVLQSSIQDTRRRSASSPTPR